MIKTFIKVRTEFEGFHCYPDAGKVHPNIEFLEHTHRHIFKVSIKISVDHSNREIEFFTCKWALQDFIKAGDLDFKSCEMIAADILNDHLIPTYGDDRLYTITVSEDGESDGIIEYSKT